MKFFFKILLLANFYLLFFASANAQVNLVPNPSFEDTLNCSAVAPQFYAKTWEQYLSCDYYNSIMHIHCSFNAQTVPNNINGFQYPHSGVAYGGFATYASFFTNYREWLQIKLTDSLQAGSSYCVSFYYSCGDNEKFATDKLGIYISSSGVNLSAPSFIQYNPQLYTTNGNILTNTTSWNQYTATFIATGGEKYITIGNFFNDVNTTVAIVHPSSTRPDAYYYIDDVSILPSDAIAFAGNDTTMCGDSTYIGRASEVGLNEDCIWYILGNATPIDTSAGLWVKPNATTSYVVEQNICGTITHDTVTVTVKPRLSLMNFNGSFITCPNDSVQIGKPILPNVTYTWSPSLGLSNTTIAQPNASPPANQVYAVTVVPTNTLYCSGIGTGTVNVTVKPTFTMSALTNTFICSGDSIQIGNASIADINYLWQPLLHITNPNNSETFVRPNITTTYSLIATPNTNSNYCIKADTIAEQIIVKPQLSGNVQLTASPKNICSNQSTQLQTVISNSVGLQWNWQPSGLVSNFSIPNPTASPTANTSYALITSANSISYYCGADTSKISVRVIKLQANANAGRDTSFCKNKTAEQIIIGSSTYPCSWCTYNWQPTTALQNANTAFTDINTSLLPTIKNYKYVLTKTDSCQLTTDTVNILLKDCTSDSVIISVPNVFTPNNDGKNDTWSMIIVNGLQIFDLQTTIYNRWGKIVFESTNTNQNWNGYNLYEGSPCNSGTYFYVISYTDGNTNETKTLNGFIELMR